MRWARINIYAKHVLRVILDTQASVMGIPDSDWSIIYISIGACRHGDQ